MQDTNISKVEECQQTVMRGKADLQLQEKILSLLQQKTPVITSHKQYGK